MTATWPAQLGKLATVTASGAVPMGKQSSWNATGGALTATLPALTSGPVATALAAGTVVRAKISKSKSDTSANAVTVTCSGSDTFEGGGATQTLLASGEKLALVAQTVPGGSGPVWVVEDHTVPRDVLDTRLAPFSALPRGGRFIILGDSLIATNEQIPGVGGVTGTTVVHQDSSSSHAAYASSGKLWYPVHAGFAGDTAAQMLARFDTDVAAYTPHIVVIAAGTNDAGQSITQASFATTIAAIVAKVRAIGAFPIIRTVPPRGDGTTGQLAGYRQLIHTYNAWIREWAPRNGVPVADIYTSFVEPATGNIAPTYAFGDKLHFLGAGYQAQGQLIAAALAPYLGAALPSLASDIADPTDLLGGIGLFLGTPAGGLPAGWTTGDAGHVTFSAAAASDGIGNELSIAATGDVGYQVRAYKYVNSGISAGDVIEFSGVMSSTAATGHTAAWQVVFQGSPATPTSIARQIASVTLANGTFREVFKVPSGTVGGFLLSLYAGPSAGTTKFRRLRVRNLTTVLGQTGV